MFDYREMELSPADRALCDYAVKLTLFPGKTGGEELADLRAEGFDDGALTTAVQVIGYFNYINRVADGLGVDPEEWMAPGVGEWMSRKADWSGSSIAGAIAVPGKSAT